MKMAIHFTGGLLQLMGTLYGKTMGRIPHFEDGKRMAKIDANAAHEMACSVPGFELHGMLYLINQTLRAKFGISFVEVTTVTPIILRFEWQSLSANPAYMHLALGPARLE
jgi:hypothetical protein